jgi:hypothetical protein
MHMFRAHVCEVNDWLMELNAYDFEEILGDILQFHIRFAEARFLGPFEK